MHRIDRFIMLAVFVTLAIYRLVRYTKAATSKGARPAIPATRGAIARTAEPPASASAASISAARDGSSPLAPPGTAPGGAALATLAGFLVLALGNAAVWLCLFELPEVEGVPVIWRLVAGVLASFYLVVLARSVAVRVRGRTAPGSQMTGGNPFPD
jgi:hypothetical protein